MSDLIDVAIRSTPESTVAIISTIATCLAVVVALGLPIYRDRQRNNKEIFQQFYVPILDQIFLYLDISTAWRRHDIRDDVDEQELADGINKQIESKLMYATASIFSMYRAVKHYEYFEDNAGFVYKIRLVELLSTILSELMKLAGKIAILDKGSIDNIGYYKRLYHIWAILAEDLNSVEAGARVLACRWYSDSKDLTQNAYKQITKRLKTCSFSHKEKTKMILEVMIHSKEKEEEILRDIENF